MPPRGPIVGQAFIGIHATGFTTEREMRAQGRKAAAAYAKGVERGFDQELSDVTRRRLERDRRMIAETLDTGDISDAVKRYGSAEEAVTRYSAALKEMSKRKELDHRSLPAYLRVLREAGDRYERNAIEAERAASSVDTFGESVTKLRGELERRTDSDLIRAYTTNDWDGLRRKFRNLDEMQDRVGDSLLRMGREGRITVGEFEKAGRSLERYVQQTERAERASKAFTAEIEKQRDAADQALERDLSRAFATGDWDRVRRQFADIDAMQVRVSKSLRQMADEGRLAGVEYDRVSGKLRRYVSQQKDAERQAIRLKKAEEARMRSFAKTLADVEAAQKRQLDRRIGSIFVDVGDNDKLRAFVREMGGLGHATQVARERMEELRREGSITTREFERHTAAIRRWRRQITAHGDDTVSVFRRTTRLLTRMEQSNERLRVIMLRRVGGAFGRGSRSEFLNIIGRIAGAAASLPFLVAKPFMAVGREIGGVVERFHEFRDAGLSVTAALGRSVLPLVGSLAGSLASLAVGFIAVATILPPLIAAFGLLAGGIAAVVWTIGTALAGSLVLLVGWLAGLAVGIGAVVVGFLAMGDEMDTLTDKFDVFRDRWEEMSTVIRPAMLDLGDAIAGLGDNFDGLEGFIVDVINAAARGVEQFDKIWSNPNLAPFIAVWETEIPRVVESALGAVGEFSAGFMVFFAAMLPQVSDMADNIEAAGRGFKDWAIENQDEIEQFISDARRDMGLLREAIGNTFVALGDILGIGADTTGSEFLQWLTDVTDKWKEWAGDEANRQKVRGFFEDVNRLYGELGDIGTELWDAIKEVDWKVAADNAVKIADGIGDIASHLDAIVRIADAIQLIANPGGIPEWLVGLFGGRVKDSVGNPNLQDSPSFLDRLLGGGNNEDLFGGGLRTGSMGGKWAQSVNPLLSDAFRHIEDTYLAEQVSLRSTARTEWMKLHTETLPESLGPMVTVAAEMLGRVKETTSFNAALIALRTAEKLEVLPGATGRIFELLPAIMGGFLVDAGDAASNEAGRIPGQVSGELEPTAEAVRRALSGLQWMITQPFQEGKTRSVEELQNLGALATVEAATLSADIGAGVGGIPGAISTPFAQGKTRSIEELQNLGALATVEAAGTSADLGLALGGVPGTMAQPFKDGVTRSAEELIALGALATTEAAIAAANLGTSLGGVSSAISTPFQQGVERSREELAALGALATVEAATTSANIGLSLGGVGDAITTPITDGKNRALAELAALNAQAAVMAASIPANIGASLGMMGGVINESFTGASNAARMQMIGMHRHVMDEASRIPASVNSALAPVAPAVRMQFTSAEQIAQVTTRQMRNSVNQIVSQISPDTRRNLSGLPSAVSVPMSSARGIASSRAGDIRTAINAQLRLIPGTAAAAISGLPSSIASVLSRALSTAQYYSSLIRASFASARASSFSLQPMASGGIVTGPTYTLLGEAGPELVIPLSRPLSQVDSAVRELSATLQGGGRNSGMNVTQYITTQAADPVRVAEATVDRIAVAIS